METTTMWNRIDAFPMKSETQNQKRKTRNAKPETQTNEDRTKRIETVYGISVYGHTTPSYFEKNKTEIDSKQSSTENLDN